MILYNISIMPAHVHALVGARVFAGTVMAKYGPVYVWN